MKYWISYEIADNDAVTVGKTTYADGHPAKCAFALLGKKGTVGEVTRDDDEMKVLKDPKPGVKYVVLRLCEVSNPAEDLVAEKPEPAPEAEEPTSEPAPEASEEHEPELVGSFG